MRPNRKLLGKILRVLLTLTLVLLAILVVNTLRFRSQQVDVVPADRIELPEQAIVDRFAQALSIETVSHANPARFDAEKFAGFHSFLEAAFPLVHQHLIRRTGTDFGDDRNQSLLYQWPGSESGSDSGSRDAILLMAHYDVVPVEIASVENWTHPPFAGIDDGQYVWGRGAIDNKGSALALLEAVEYLLAQGFVPDRTVYLSLGHDEEVGGSHGNLPISQWMRRQGIHLDYVLDEGGGIFNDFAGLNQPAAFIGIGEKGFVTVEITAEVSEAGHSSMPPPIPDTALGILGQALHRLQEHPHPAHLDGGIDMTLDYVGPEMALPNRAVVANRWLFAPLLLQQLGGTPLGNAAIRTTIAPTVATAGVKDNVLPTRASMTVNLRIHPNDKLDSAVEHLRSTIADERVSIRPLEPQRPPSPLSSTESTAFRQLQRTILEIYPSVVVAPFVVVAGTDASHYDDRKLSRNVYRFVPWRLGKNDLKRIHGIDERLSRDDYLDMVRFYERLLRNTASGTST